MLDELGKDWEEHRPKASLAEIELFINGRVHADFQHNLGIWEKSVVDWILNIKESGQLFQAQGVLLAIKHLKHIFTTLAANAASEKEMEE